MRTFLFISLMLSVSLSSNSQNTFFTVKADSLFKEITVDQPDTTKVNLFLEIANEVYHSNPDTALYFCNLAMQKSVEVNFKTGIESSCNWLGYLYWQKGDLQEALIQFNLGLSTIDADNLKDKGDLQNNIGYVYKDLGDLKKGLSFLQKGLTTRILGKDSSGISNSLNNIGLIHKDLGDFDLALDYFNKSYDIKVKIGEYNAVATTLNNIAMIYGIKGDRSKALESLYKALELSKKQNNLSNIAMIQDNLGVHFERVQNNDSALFYYNSSIKTSQLGGVKYWEASALANLGSLLAKLGNTRNAKKYTLDAYKIAKETGYPERIRDISEQLSLLYQNEGDWKKSFKYQNEYISMRDSIINASNKRKIITQEIQYKYEQQKIADSLVNRESQKVLQAELTAQKAVAENEKNEKQQNLIWTITGIVILSLVIFFLLRINSIRKNSNQKLSQQNIEIEKSSIELTQMLSERDLLLKEIHHRVKNNLQTVSSLLSLQSRYLDDPNATKALEESQNRLLSISLLHQKLYQNDTLPVVVFSQYLDELTSQVKNTCEVSGKVITVKHYSDALTCDIEVAMPLGLMINELMTNAYKYAFKDRESGQIEISLSEVSDSNYELTVSDDGIGLPSDFSLNTKRNSMGLNLVKLLTKQIKGSLEVKQDDGTTFIVSFPIKKKHNV